MKKILIFLSLLSSLLLSLNAKENKPIIVDELEVYIENHIIIVDIRDKRKWKTTGIIPNSYRLTYNEKEEEKWLYTLIKLIKDKNRPFVLISKKGEVAKTLSAKLLEKKINNVMYLDGGIDEWIDSDRKVINY
ncbi:MAG: hypothetical protein CL624_11570 [Arcobacter sp.]|nr:hypothetical protein [Arcobacter sp.]|tara:strand:- start:2260 stop:2658 length:399 start_codon:yes stop_codon:yes gene_type:complete